MNQCDHYRLVRAGGTCSDCGARFPGNLQAPSGGFAFSAPSEPRRVVKSYEHVTWPEPGECRILHGFINPDGRRVPKPERLHGAALASWQRANVRSWDVLDPQSPDPVGDAVAFLRECRCVEPKQMGPEAAPTQWGDGAAWFDPETGESRTEFCHLEGYTKAERREIYERLYTRR